MLYKYLQSYVIVEKKITSRKKETRSELHIRYFSRTSLQWDEAALRILGRNIKHSFLSHHVSHVRTSEIILRKSDPLKFTISYSSKTLHHDIRVREAEWLKEGRLQSRSTSREVSK
jgi:hypothetical protein